MNFWLTERLARSVKKYYYTHSTNPNLNRKLKRQAYLNGKTDNIY